MLHLHLRGQLILVILEVLVGLRGQPLHQLRLDLLHPGVLVGLRDQLVLAGLLLLRDLLLQDHPANLVILVDLRGQPHHQLRLDRLGLLHLVTPEGLLDQPHRLLQVTLEVLVIPVDLSGRLDQLHQVIPVDQLLHLLRLDRLGQRVLLRQVVLVGRLLLRDLLLQDHPANLVIPVGLLLLRDR